MLISDYDKKDESDITELINKIKRVDTDLYDMISSRSKKQIKLLPVIINSNYNDLNQAFLLGINDVFS